MAPTNRAGDAADDDHHDHDPPDLERSVGLVWMPLGMQVRRNLLEHVIECALVSGLRVRPL